MDRSTRFGSIPRDSGAHLGLAFATAPPVGLTLPRRITRCVIMQKARSQAYLRRDIALLPRVGMRFQDLLIPLSGFFSPFPHGTSSLSVAR